MAAIGAMVKNKFVILCVDDEENPLVLRKFLLQKAGYEVITAKSGLEALKIASSEAIDLVLSDHLMPGITGTELARQMKLEHPKLPVVLLSGMNEIPTGADRSEEHTSELQSHVNLVCRLLL